MVSNGAKHCIANALLALVDPGDEVVIPAPHWVSYGELVKLAGGIPISLPTLAVRGLQAPGRRGLEAAMGPRTKALILCSPSNPTGAVYSGERARGPRGRPRAPSSRLGHQRRGLRAHRLRRRPREPRVDPLPRREDCPRQRRVQGLRDDGLAHRLPRGARRPREGLHRPPGPDDHQRVLDRATRRLRGPRVRHHPHRRHARGLPPKARARGRRRRETAGIRPRARPRAPSTSFPTSRPTSASGSRGAGWPTARPSAARTTSPNFFWTRPASPSCPAPPSATTAACAYPSPPPTRDSSPPSSGWEKPCKSWAELSDVDGYLDSHASFIARSPSGTVRAVDWSRSRGRLHFAGLKDYALASPGRMAKERR